MSILPTDTCDLSRMNADQRASCQAEALAVFARLVSDPQNENRDPTELARRAFGEVQARIRTGWN